MSLITIFLKLYFEIGGVLLFVGGFFGLSRWGLERTEIKVSPSLLRRLAQGLVLSSVLFSTVGHLLPESQVKILNFEVVNHREDSHLIQRHQENFLATSMRPLPVLTKVNQVGAFKQRLRDFFESGFDANASLIVLVLLCLGWSFMMARLLRHFRDLEHLIFHSLVLRQIGRAWILVSDQISIPFSALVKGQAFVVLPQALSGHQRDFKFATLHELQHHRCGDTAWARMIEILIALYFWNPGIYLWKKEIIQLQELACDETLIGQRRVSPREYGNCLLKVAEAALVYQDMRIGTVCMAGGPKNKNRHVSFLRRRIDMFEFHSVSRRKTALGLALGTISLLVTTAVAFGAQQVFRSTPQLAPNPGNLRVDPAIQSIAESTLGKYLQKFKAKAGFVLVSEVGTGRLLAAANISDDPAATKNWALAYELEPASAIKVPILAAALNQGATSPDEVHDCGDGVATIGHGTYHDWKPFGHLTTSAAIIQSSNICSIRVAQKIGSGGVAQAMFDFGFGAGGTTATFPQARAGEIPDPSLYPAEDYLSVVTVGLNAIPHFHVTPLEMVQAFGAIANRGRLMKPILADAPDSAIELMHQAVSERTANEMTAILRRAVLEGTGRSAKSSIYTTAGKTSSAFAPKSPGHENTGGERAMAGFVGFAPVSDPRLVVYVGVFDPHEKDDPNAHGNRQAAPIFKDVIEAALQTLNVPSDLPSEKN